LKAGNSEPVKAHLIVINAFKKDLIKSIPNKKQEELKKDSKT